MKFNFYFISVSYVICSIIYGILLSFFSIFLSLVCLSTFLSLLSAPAQSPSPTNFCVFHLLLNSIHSFSSSLFSISFSVVHYNGLRQSLLSPSPISHIQLFATSSIMYLKYLSSLFSLLDFPLGCSHLYFHYHFLRMMQQPPKRPFCLLLSLSKAKQTEINRKKCYFITEYLLNPADFSLKSAFIQPLYKSRTTYLSAFQFFFSKVKLLPGPHKSVHWNWQTMIFGLPLFFWLKIIYSLPYKT